MKKLHIIGIVTVLAASVLGAFLWISYSDMMFELRHDTDRWAVIEDREGSRMAVEPMNDEIWDKITQLYQNQSTRFLGGIVERYENKWSFRFKPENVTVAEFTAEGLQANIRYISEHLEYWLGGWAYVAARVTETHSPETRANP
nr:hypothetical protein [Candidatus Njordarchaeum guaymaensis]